MPENWLCDIRATTNFAFMIRTVFHEATQHREAADTEVLTAISPSYSLIVWNDEINTFEWVIDTLIEICGHSTEQAEQCAMLIHTQGKYAVKKGEYEILKPLCEAITDRGIGATIEVMAI